MLASVDHFAFGLFLETLLGIGLVIASACVFNNYIDRGIDDRMARTKRRALVTGSIGPAAALIYGTVLGAAGFAVLIAFTNWLTVGLNLLAIVWYVAVYGLAKRRSVWGTVVGAIPGAIPPVAGYTAVTGSLDSASVILFASIFLWQMPHFYAIAMYRFTDYKAAGLPVWPVKKGMTSAKRQIIGYIVAFTIASSLLSGFGHTGYIYLVGVILLGGWWLLKGLRGYSTQTSQKWGRQMFLASLIVNLGLCVLIALGGRLP